MSGGSCCKCSETKEPLNYSIGVNRPGRLWRVAQWRCNHSAFNGYHKTHSAYSSIRCLRCGAAWRTKAPYADALPPLEETDINTCPGVEGYEATMEALGRTPYVR